MSHVASVKKLLSDDLKSLIKQLTGFEEGSGEFKKCEDNSWSIIIERYYPSVNEHRVKSTIHDFVHKFKVHGFPQKAQNLATLIESYSKLPYFQKFNGSEVQWGLIDLLVKLSQKPTNCLKDDPPLDLFKHVEKNEESFDWGAYLKEGNEKFRLPSEDEGSLSDWSDDDEDKKNVSEVESCVQKQDILVDNLKQFYLLPPPPPPDLKQEAKERSLAAADWLKKFTQGNWWNNETFRELPKSQHPEANFCFEWEKLKNSPPETRILSEYKVLRELIYLLAQPSDCYFIKECSKDVFKVTPKTSVSSLSPTIFTSSVEENFCKYLPHIRKLRYFCTEMNSENYSSCVPATYRSYAAAIDKLLNQFLKNLLKFEETVDAQASTVTLFHLSTEFFPFLNQFHFLSKLHDELVPDNWRERDKRTNAFSLLCRLYDELTHMKMWNYGDTMWPSQKLLILFIESIYPFLMFLAQSMSGYLHELMSDEFFLSSSGEILVSYKNLDSSEFWEGVLTAASAAITSCCFLTELGKESSFFSSAYPPDILFVKVVEKLSEMLFFQPLNVADTSSEGNHCDNSNEVSGFQGLFDGSLWDRVFREVVAPPRLNLFDEPSVSDRFSERISKTDLSSYAVTIALKKSVKSVVEEYMEPKGFASEILLKQLNLLGHLNALYTSLHVTSVLSTVLISEFQKVKNWKKIMWFSKFENCLSDVLPHEYVQKFELVIDKNLYFDDVTTFNISDYMQLYYKADDSIATLITNDIIQDYARIFSFLLKTRIALGALSRLSIKCIEENENNFLRLRRLCSLRIWLLHIMYSINFYFSTYSDVNFQQKMKELCLNERNLYNILKAHEEFVENWKYHCFVSTGHPGYENVLELISIISKLNLFYKMEHQELLKDFNLDDLEKSFMDCMKSFTANLQLFDNQLLERNDTFSFLYDEVINNLPASLD